MAVDWRPILVTLVSTLTASASVTTVPAATSTSNVDSRVVAVATGSDLFVEPDFIVLPTCVSGDKVETTQVRATVPRSDRRGEGS